MSRREETRRSRAEQRQYWHRARLIQCSAESSDPMSRRRLCKQVLLFGISQPSSTISEIIYKNGVYLRAHAMARGSVTIRAASPEEGAARPSRGRTAHASRVIFEKTILSIFRSYSKIMAICPGYKNSFLGVK